MANAVVVESLDETAIVYEEDLDDLKALIVKARKILDRDGPMMAVVQDYLDGIMADPYKPKGATDEYELLIQRSKVPILGLVLSAPAQAMYVEGYRAGDDDSKSQSFWKRWQSNQLDAAQARVYRGALSFGRAYVGVEKGKPRGKRKAGGPKAFTLSPMRTVALWYDPANDTIPAAVVTWDVMPTLGRTGGRGRIWTDESVTTFKFNESKEYELGTPEPHGMSVCPIVAFDAFRDLEGNTHGIIEKLIPIQDAVNQTKFDLLVAQTYGSFKVRTAAGLTPPPKRAPVAVTVGEARPSMDPDDPRQDLPDDVIFGYRMEVILDEHGEAIPEPITADITRFLVAADPEVKFGQLDETPLNGFIESIGMSFHQIAAVSQIPPHHLLGNLANLSADALAVAESSLFRMVAELQHAFGEGWEQVLCLLAEADGEGVIDLPEAEVMWRDMSARSIGAVTDSLGKMVQMLGVPEEGAWTRVPGVTAAEIEKWKKQKAEQEEKEATQLREESRFQASLQKANVVATRAKAAAKPVQQRDAAA
jgi:hypothetical protein